MALTYTKPKLIIGEGKSDMRFFQKLVMEHNLNDFQADWPKSERDPTGGWSKFGQYLRALHTSPTFVSVVRRVVVASDHDDDESFGRICKQLKAADYSVPNAPKQFVSTRNKPDIAILLIPDDTTGCLETLCYQAACVKWPGLQNPLENYLARTPAGTWTANKKDKMKIQCVLASTCEHSPDVRLQDHWQQADEFHIPVNIPPFQGIVDFLTSV